MKTTVSSTMARASSGRPDPGQATSREAGAALGRHPAVRQCVQEQGRPDHRTELVVAITPRIIKDSGQIRAITEEFRDKINFTTRPQRDAPPDRREQVDRVLR